MTKRPHLAFAFIALLSVTACDTVVQNDEVTINQIRQSQLDSFPFEQMAPKAPPSTPAEVRGRPPGNIADEYAWRQGTWIYVDGQGFVWKNGYWLRKPAFTSVWKQDAWLQRTYGWTFVPGYWE